MSEHVLSVDHHPTLRHADREAIGAELQSVLVVLTDLALLGKHAHWNVQGPHFRSLHLQLDEMIDAWRAAGDAVAERAVALGYAPDGRAETISSRSTLPALEAGPQRDAELVRRLTAILTEAVGVIRERNAPIEDLDPVTSDVLHGVIAKLEEQLWMVRVQGA